MSEVDVYLDVDGVLNAVCLGEPREWGWGKSTLIRVNGFGIRYSPWVVERFNSLAARPDVNMHWLTTWEHDAAAVLAPQIGLNGQDWPVLGTEHHYSRELDCSWWKLAAAREHFMSNGNRAVWIDDDLIDSTAREWAEPFVADGLLMLVQPLSERGLTLAEFAAVETWIDDADLKQPSAVGGRSA